MGKKKSKKKKKKKKKQKVRYVGPQEIDEVAYQHFGGFYYCVGNKPQEK